MDRVCQYSTIIFAGNVVVLILVALSTDYWRYHGFLENKTVRAKLVKALEKNDRTKLIIPHDTDTYVIIRYFWQEDQMETPLPTYAANETYYQPPLLLKRYKKDYEELYHSLVFNGTHNTSKLLTRQVTHWSQDTLVVFLQYTNLFRDCDDLEMHVRRRLGIEHYREGRCCNFITGFRRDDDFVLKELPAVIHLERVTFFFAIVSIIASVASVWGGVVGSLFHDKYGMFTASSMALASGVGLTITIAVFHAKCHLIERHELLSGVQLPHKTLLQEFRQQYFGWSFGLAWICIVLCYIHTWVWLSKSQDMPDISRLKKHSRNHYPRGCQQTDLLSLDDEGW